MTDFSDLTPAVCPRCGGAFGCGVASKAPCACTRIRLSDALRAQLRERYSGCLCPNCLLALGGELLDGRPSGTLNGSSSAGPAGR